MYFSLIFINILNFELKVNNFELHLMYFKNIFPLDYFKERYLKFDNLRIEK